MTTRAQPRPAAPEVRPVPLPLRDRLLGLGSVFGKAVRDSRRGFIVEVILLGALPLVVLGAITRAYPTQAARDEIARLATTLGPAAQGITQKPVNVGTMGGYVQWKYGAVFALIAAFWSILTLTGTLAGEARRGSLDFLATAPISRRRLAAEKIAAHVTVLTVVALVMALATRIAGVAFAKLPGDDVPVQASVGIAAWIWLMALAFGGSALVLAQFLGRAAGAWIAGTVLCLGPVLDNLRTLRPGVGPIADLTPWAWTANHLPLAGRYDWTSLLPVAGLAVVLLLAGIETFARRDMGATDPVRMPRLPRPALGLHGPFGRSFGERAPLAIAWGLGLGGIGMLLAASSQALATAIRTSPDLARAFSRVFPGSDLGTAGGFLQLMVQLMFIVAGFAAVALVTGWAGDEGSGRLEVVLSAPLSRRSYAVRSGLGVLAAIGLMTAVLALGIGGGAASAGSDALTPMAGSLSLGLFAAALAGLGFAVAGLVSSSVAGPVTATALVATYLLDVLAPALKLPEAVHDPALTVHFGRPMIGHWDAGGLGVCLVLVVGGLALGAVGLDRRDLER